MSVPWCGRITIFFSFQIINIMSNSENPKILDANVEIPDPKPEDNKAKAEDVHSELADDSNQSLDVPPTQAPITDGAAPKADFVEAPKHVTVQGSNDS